MQIIRRRSPLKKCPAAMASVLAAVLAISTPSAARADNFTPKSTSATVIATGTSGSNYTNTEGPIYDDNGDILFCELNHLYSNDLIWSYNIATKSASIVVSSSGGTEGDFFNSSGNLVTADRDLRQVSVRSLSNLSSPTAITSSYNGKKFNGPNDLVVDSAGGIFFTDPNFENFSNNPGVDAVYYITPADTVNQVLTYGTTGRPNGIILSPDQSKLYVGLWNNNVIDVYDLNSAGVPTNGRTFTTVAHPDGMTIDPWGNIIVARTGGVSCYNPTGTKLFDVSTADSNASNVELYDNTLYITVGISLYDVALTAPTPEPASLGILASGAAFLLLRRRR